jgi:hypothetical protein
MSHPPVRRPDAPQIASDLRGVSRLAVDATLGLTSLVENLHRNILSVPAPLGTASQRPARGLTGLVYRSIRGVTRVVGVSVDALLGRLERLPGGPPAAAAVAQRESLVAALNGVLGDHLVASGNPLAIKMALRHDGRALTLEPAVLARDLPDAKPTVLLLLHGLCMQPMQWRQGGVDIGATLAAETGATLLHLHYNSGLHVAANGLAVADRLQALQAAWPVELREVVVVAHSMGGLLMRSALHQAAQRGDAWPAKVSRIFFLGPPHHGAPLERGGHWLTRLLGASPYTAAFARLGRVRSAGITDLRHGSLLDADRAGADRHAHGRDTRVRVPLPAGIECFALAGVRSPAGGDASALQRGLVGDGLVPLDSALGRHPDPTRALAFDEAHRWIGEGIGHLELMAHPRVLLRLREALVVPARTEVASA